MNLFAFQLVTPDVNLWLILPELIVCIVGVAVMLVDAFAKPAQRWVTGALSMAGLLVAAAGSAWLWLSWRNVGQAFNGMIVLDELRLGFTFVFIIVSALTILVSIVWVENERLPAGEFHSLLMFATAGMMFMASAGDLVMVFLGLEILSIATYVMCGFRRTDIRSNESSMKYFILGSFSSAFLLYGIALVYGASSTAAGLPGTTNTAEIARRAVSATALHRRSDDAGRFWFQDCHRAVSRLDAGCLRGRAHAGYGVHGRRSKSCGLCFVRARVCVRVSFRGGNRRRHGGGTNSFCVVERADRARYYDHDNWKRGGNCAEQREAHARLFVDCPRGLCAGRIYRRRRRRRYRTAQCGDCRRNFLFTDVCGDESRRLCRGPTNRAGLGPAHRS